MNQVGGVTFQWALYIAAIHKMTPWVLKEFQKWSFMQILPILLVVFSFILHIFVQYLLQCNDKKYPSMVGGRGGGVVANDTNVYCCPVHHTQVKLLKVLFFFFFSFFGWGFILASVALLSASCCRQRGPALVLSWQDCNWDKSFPRLAEGWEKIKSRSKPKPRHFCKAENKEENKHKLVFRAGR